MTQVRWSYDHHAIIYGKTSSGKSYFGTRLFQTCPYRAVYWNRQEERMPYPERRSWDISMLKEPGSKVNLIPPKSKEQSDILLSRITDDLFRVGRVAARDRKPLVVFFHDEPDREAPAWDKESGAYEMAVRGNRHGVKYVGLTQGAAQISKSVRRNVTTEVIFALSAEEEEYMRRARVPEEVWEWVKWDMVDGEARPTYRFAVNQGAGWVMCQPIAP